MLKIKPLCINKCFIREKINEISILMFIGMGLKAWDFPPMPALISNKWFNYAPGN